MRTIPDIGTLLTAPQLAKEYGVAQPTIRNWLKDVKPAVTQTGTRGIGRWWNPIEAHNACEEHMTKINAAKALRKAAKSTAEPLLFDAAPVTPLPILDQLEEKIDLLRSDMESLKTQNQALFRMLKESQEKIESMVKKMISEYGLA